MKKYGKGGGIDKEMVKLHKKYMMKEMKEESCDKKEKKSKRSK